MATTTTNYGWDIPQSTDLVKDGATAIALLGQDIDTSMNTALAGKKAGMVLLNTTSFSAVSSFSLATSTFTTSYVNYKLIINIDTKSAAGQLNLRFRKAGTDNSSNNYWSSYGSISNSGTFSNGSGSAPSTSALFTPSFSTNAFVDIGIYNVAVTGKPFFQGFTQNTTGTAQTYCGGLLDVSDIFDSVTITSSSGTLTGSYSIYGFNK
jgi:hypothetical protein